MTFLCFGVKCANTVADVKDAEDILNVFLR